MKNKHIQDMVCMKKDLVDVVYAVSSLRRMLYVVIAVISCSEGMQGCLNIKKRIRYFLLIGIDI